MLAEIITIGDEILIGQIIDTNSAWIATRLNAIGVRVKQISSVSDNREHIIEALKEAKQRADLVILTGGLGPTKDDITKKTLAEYFGVNLRRDAKVLEEVTAIFTRFNRPMLEVNNQQADVPENCVILHNQNGTAPGMWFDHEGTVYVSMPGVPFEMMYMVDEQVLPKIKDRFSLPYIYHKTILTAGLGESFLAQKIEHIEDSLPDYIKLAYLPKLGQLRLRLSTSGNDEVQMKAEVELYAQQIVTTIKEHIIAEEDISIEKAILDYMDARNLTLTTAESCTGGYIAHLITQHPGCSSVFLGGAVAYAYEIKEHVLGVQPETLTQFGAVSEETVSEMAIGALHNLKSDYAIAVSGIAGPDGGTPDKPVGTVWIAVAGKGEVRARKFLFGNKRIQNIERSAISALGMLFTMLKEHHD